MRGNDQLSEHQYRLNSVQLNIVTVVDVARAAATGSLDGAMYMTDNSVGGRGRGTARLETVCKQGQVLNWIIRGIDMDRRPDGSWPVIPRICNIVFLDEEAGEDENVTDSKICTELKIYGMPDGVRSPVTPVYRYWAGTVAPTLGPGTYRYRLIIEFEQAGRTGTRYLTTLSHPSIVVRAIDPRDSRP
jgi:hypothetical protein